VIDAAGAIYVIGGQGWGGMAIFQDVWASTDGGAWPVLVRDVVGGYYRTLRGYFGGTWETLEGWQGD
jgi:hypothetical protein